MANKRNKLDSGQSLNSGGTPPSFASLLDAMAQAGEHLSTAIVARSGKSIEIGHFVIQPLGLEITADVSFTEWKQFAADLRRLEQGLHWVIGDLFLYARGRLDEWSPPAGEGDAPDLRYQDLIEATGYSYKTLRNIVSVCANVPMSRRRDNLSFSHHAEVAYLDETQQEDWLDQAAMQRWSRNQLRAALQAGQVTPAARPAWDARLDRFEKLVTQRQWRKLPLAERAALRQRLASLLTQINAWDNDDDD